MILTVQTTGSCLQSVGNHVHANHITNVTTIPIVCCLCGHVHVEYILYAADQANVCNQTAQEQTLTLTARPWQRLRCQPVK
jgi:hypothetical protein